MHFSVLDNNLNYAVQQPFKVLLTRRR